MESINLVRPLHDMGLALIYLMPRSKRPIAQKWTEGPRITWAQLEKDFKKNLNLGVRLGSASKLSDGTFLCVLDCDVKSSDKKHLKEMQDALYDFCKPVDFAPRVLSGRGGGSCHIYLRTPAPQVSFKAVRSKSHVRVLMPSVQPSQVDRDKLTTKEIKAGYRMRLAWEIDVFGEGKQVVLPPSIHPDTGACYEWEGKPPQSFDSLPLVENFKPKELKKVKNTGFVKFEGEFVDIDLFDVNMNAEAFDLITKGQGMDKFPSRSEALFSVLNTLVRAGLKDAEILSILTDKSYFMSEKALEKGSREQGAYWLVGQLNKVRQDYVKSKAFLDEAEIEDMSDILALNDEEIAEQENEVLVKHWTDELEVTKNGSYKNTAKNVYLILKNLYRQIDKVAPPIVALNLFEDKLLYLHAPPWGDEYNKDLAIEDVDLVKSKVWLSTHWGIEVATNTIYEMLLMIGTENGFHPVKDYLESLEWDGRARLKNLMRYYAGAEGNSNYLEAVSVKMLCAAIARVYRPGVKYDQVVILEGEQGIGKSRFVKALAGEWFTDNLGDISNKDVVDVMAGKWLIELGELAGLKKAEENELKAFISRTHDKVRKAYGRVAKEYPRQCIFIGTTNNSEYLKDETGGRRYWPLRTTKFKIEQLERDRDQIWAEALVRFKAGEKLWIDDKEIHAIATMMQSTRRIVDILEASILEIIEGEGFPKEFGLPDIWNGLKDKNLNARADCDPRTQSRIAKALRSIGYENRVVWDGEKTARKWFKIK